MQLLPGAGKWQFNPYIQLDALQYYSICLNKLSKRMKYIDISNLSQGWFSKPGPLEYDAGVPAATFVRCEDNSPS
jgi:hypothetical protein